MRLALGLVLVLLVAGGCAEEPQTDSRRHPMAWTMNAAGYSVVWAGEPTSEQPVRLSPAEPNQTDAHGSVNPAWSPDGTRVAYASSGEATREDQSDQDIYVVDADGTNTRQLTDDDVMDEGPTWSPDGERIAFARLTDIGTSSPNGTIVVIDADGGERRAVTTHGPTQPPRLDAEPDWSPDGRRILFTRVTYGPDEFGVELRTISPDGGDERRLIRDATSGDWSPNGTKIVFTSSRDRNGRTCYEDCTPSQEIYVADADRSNVRRLTRSKADDYSPVWSRDGRQIAFLSDRSDPNAHQYEIYLVDASGGKPRRLTTGGGSFDELAWY